MKSLSVIYCTPELLKALQDYIKLRNDFIDGFDMKDYLKERKTFWGKAKLCLNPDGIKAPKGVFMFEDKPYKKGWFCDLEKVYNQMRLATEILADQDVFDLLSSAISEDLIKEACENN